MKKMFTVDAFMVAIISALGYGFGEIIARLSGWPKLMCGVASLVLGVTLESIISKIIFSKTIQKKRKYRVFAFTVILLVLIAAECVAAWWMNSSMFDYVMENFMYVVVIPVFGFVLNLCIRSYRIWKIRRLYGDGSKGYTFHLTKKEIEEINQQNQPITGKYDAELAVKTRTGIYVGEKHKNTISYLGIPYAKPPIGQLRWKAPEALASSEAVFEAGHFGASAIQVDHEGSILKHYRQSEDCLYLNICVGAQKTKTKKPVLVLFHHGDFSFGGSADPLLYGRNFVEAHPDVVFVSFNYRLGIFGFVDFSEVPGGEAYPDAVNLGLLDQIAALRWIKENIKAFGGNPERITTLGFESGAISILLLAACEQAKGLFQKAFLFNGNLMYAYDTPEGAKAAAKDLLKETKAATMDELMQLDTQSLKDVAQRMWKNHCAPTCDGTLIPVDVYQAFQEGVASGIKFIIGFPAHEMQVLRSFIDAENYEVFVSEGMAGMQQYLDGSISNAVQDYIKTQAQSLGEIEAKTKLLDQWIALCIYLVAVWLSKGGNKVNLMYWDEKPLMENLGSGTVDVLAALLGNNDALQMYGDVINADLSNTLQNLLLKFIKGNALQLYSNEIKGVDAFVWKAFPKALIVADGKMTCDTIKDKITEVEGLFDLV